MVDPTNGYDMGYDVFFSFMATRLERSTIVMVRAPRARKRFWFRGFWRRYWRTRGGSRTTEVRVSNEALAADCGFAATSTPKALALTPAELTGFRRDCCALRERHGATSFFLSVAQARALLREPSPPALLA